MSLAEKSMLREPTDGKTGRAVLAIALAAATVMLVLAVAALVGLVIQRNFGAGPVPDREAFHTAPQPPEGAQP